MNNIPNYMQNPAFFDSMVFPPYYYQPIVPYQPQMFLRNKLAGPKLASALRTAQKTISTASKVIPAIYQMQPVINNARTAFKVAKAMKSMDMSEDIKEEAIDVVPVTKEEIITNQNNPYIPST